MATDRRVTRSVTPTHLYVYVLLVLACLGCDPGPKSQPKPIEDSGSRQHLSAPCDGIGGDSLLGEILTGTWTSSVSLPGAADADTQDSADGHFRLTCEERV